MDLEYLFMDLEAVTEPATFPTVPGTLDDTGTFEVSDLTSINFASVDISSSVENYFGQIAVSESNIHVIDETTAVSLGKDTLEATITALDQTAGFSVVTNIANNKMYAIGDSDGEFLLGATGYAQSLIPLQAATLLRDTNQQIIHLTEPVYISFQSTVYAGFNRAYIMDIESSDYFQINLPNGHVKVVGEVMERANVNSIHWLSFAVAENSALGVRSVIYASEEGGIERQSVDIAHEAKVVFTPQLGTIATVALDFPANKWYYYYSGEGSFGAGAAILGYADAAFVLNSDESSNDLFSVQELAKDGAVSLDVSPSAGHFFQTLAISSSRVFASGDFATVSLSKDSFQLSSVESSATGAVGDYFFVTDLSNNDIFALGDSDGNFLTGPTGYAECLIPLSATSALRDPSRRIIWLTVPVYMSLQASVHNGLRRLLIVDLETSDVFQVNMRNGAVTCIGEALPRTPDGAGAWLNYGVAELPSAATPALLYAAVEGGIERQTIAHAENYINEKFDSSLGDIASIAVDAVEGEWYYFYEGIGVFGAGGAVLGRAPAAVSFDDMQPTSMPTAYPSAVGGTTTEDSFKVLRFTARHAEAVDITIAAGNFYGTVGLSTSNIFARGDRVTISIPKGPKLASGEELWVAVEPEIESHSFVTNIANNDLYALGDGDGNALEGPTGLLECLIPLHPSTGARNPMRRILWFTEPIYLGFQSSVHWAYNRVIFVDHESSAVFVAHLRNGIVTPLDETLVRSVNSNPYWLTMGLAELQASSVVTRRALSHLTTSDSTAEYSLLYASCEGDIERQDLSDSSANVTSVFAGSLGDMASIAVDASSSRWYFYYAGEGAFGSGDAILGRAFAHLELPAEEEEEVGESIMTVVKLTESRAEAVEVSSIIGDFYGILALSSSRVFASGASSTISLAKGPLNDAAVVLAETIADSPVLVSDLSTSRLYMIGDSDGNALQGPTGYAECLVPLLPESVQRDETRRIVWFSDPIYLGIQSMVLSGQRCVLFRDQESSETHSVSLSNGMVTLLSETMDDGGSTPAWLHAGVVERPSFTDFNLIYASAGGSVVRQTLTNETRVEDLFSPVLGAAASIAVDVFNSKWYFFYSGDGSFGSGVAVLGRANAIIAMEVDQPDPFGLQSLQTSGAKSVDVSSLLSEFGGPIGLTSSSIFIGGDATLLGLNKDSLLEHSSEVLDFLPVLVGNLIGTQLYALGDGDGNVLTGPTAFAESLIPLFANSAARDTSRKIIYFTSPVYLGFHSSIYAGFYRAAFVDGESGTVSVVNMRTGQVTELAADAVDRASESPFWVNSGVVDQQTVGHFRLFYGSKEGTVEMQDLSDDKSSLETVFSSTLGEVASIAADVSSSRWYYYYTGDGAFNTSDAIVGYADLAYSHENFSTIAPSSIPSSIPTSMPSSHPSAVPSSSPSCQPSAFPTGLGLEDDLFEVLVLTEREVRSADLSTDTGYFQGAIAISSSKVFVTGASATVSLEKDLASSVNYVGDINSIVVNLASQEIYALGDAEGNFLDGPVGLVECFITLLPDTGARNTARRLVWLSQPFYLGFQSSVFSGFHRALFIDSESSSAFLVNLRTGRVTTTMEDTLDRISLSANWLNYGIADQPEVAEYSLLYGSLDGAVERQEIFSSTLNVSNLTSPISEVMSISLDLNSSRWYFYYTGQGLFGSGEAVLGYATAMYTTEGPPPQDIFSVRELLDEGKQSVDVSPESGPFYGALGVSNSHVFARGTVATVRLEKGSTGSISEFERVSAEEVWGFDFVMDVGRSQMYGLGDGDGNAIVNPSVYVESLIPLRGASGQRDLNKRLVWLSTPIYLGLHSSVHSGHRRILLVDSESGSAYVIGLRNGRVTMLDDVVPRSEDSPYWLHFGVAEQPYPDEYTLIYGSDEGFIERQLVKASSPVARAFLLPVGSTASIAVDISENRWYYFYNGEGALGSGAGLLGYATASFSFEEIEPTSMPSAHPSMVGDEDDFFTVKALSAEDAITVDVSEAAGFYHGTLAVSQSRLYVRGTEAMLSVPKDDLNLQNGSISVKPHGKAFYLVTDASSNQMYALGDGEGDFVTEKSTTMLVECFIPLLPDTVQRDTSKRLTWFTRVIYLGFQSTLYSGYHRIVIVDEESGNAFVIKMRNGRVDSLEEDILARGVSGAYGLRFGVAEHPNHEDYNLLYAALDGSVERQHIGHRALVETVVQPSLGDVASIAIDSVTNSWYFFYLGSSSDGSGMVFGTSGDAVLGKASATFLFDDMQPTSQPSAAPTTFGFAADIFVLNSISEANALAVDVSGLTGDYFGSLAVSSRRIFVSGTEATVSVPLNLNISEALSSTDMTVGAYIYVTHVGNNRLYAFGDVDGDFVERPLGFVWNLIACDPDTGARDERFRILWLSQPILLTYKSVIYSGNKRVVVFDRVSSRALIVSLENGKVILAGDVVDRFPTAGAQALSFGVTELPFRDENQLLYAGLTGQVERQKISVNDRAISVVLTATLGDVASIAVDNSTNSWYYFYTGVGTFGTSTALLGRADSVPVYEVQAPTSYPTSVPSEAGLDVDSFAVFNFSSSASEVADFSHVIGGFTGMLVLSGEHLIVGGDAATVSVPTSAISSVNATYLDTINDNAYVLVSDLSNNKPYVFGDGEGNFMSGPVGLVECLIAVHPNTLERDTSQRTMWLTRVILLSYQSGIYAGNRRVVIADKVSTLVYVVNLRNGRVTVLGTAIDRAPVAHAVPLTHGIAEHPYSTEYSIVYGSVLGQIERQWVSASHNGIDVAFEYPLGDVTSITVDAQLNVWYFCYAGDGFFGNSSALLGSARIAAEFEVAEPSSYPTSYPTVAGMEEDFFSVQSLSPFNAVAVDMGDRLGHFVGQIAISSSRVFVAGSEASVGFHKDTLEEAALTSSGNFTIALRASNMIVSNIANNQMYALCDGDGHLVEGPSAYFEGFVALDPDTAERDTSKRIIWMTQVLFVPYKSSVYAGMHRVVIFNKITSELHYINLRNGRVTSFGDDLLDRLPVASAGWVTTGVVDHPFFGENAIIYSSLTGQVERQPFPSEEPLVDVVFDGYLGDAASIAVDAESDKWYFHYTGAGAIFGNGTAVLGYAEASLYFDVVHPPTSLPSGQPSSQPSGIPSVQPSSQPSGTPSVQPSSQPSRRPSGQPSCQPSSSPTAVHTPQPTRSGTQMYFTITQVGVTHYLLVAFCLTIFFFNKIYYTSIEIRGSSIHIRFGVQQVVARCLYSDGGRNTCGQR